MYGTVIIFEKKSEKVTYVKKNLNIIGYSKKNLKKSDVLAKKSEHNWERAEQKKRACWNRKKKFGLIHVLRNSLSMSRVDRSEQNMSEKNGII